MRVEIIPAVIPESFDAVKNAVESTSTFVSSVQVDVVDGLFVPSVSWPYREDGSSELPELTSQGVTFPHAEEVFFEVDLMVESPEEVIPDWITLGARRVIVHIESLDDTETFINQFRSGYADIELVFALNTTTSNEELYPYIASIDGVQCMGIERIGYQGQSFDDRVLRKIADLREKYPELPISVDGGVNTDTAASLRDAGATRLVSGSAIFKSDDIGGTIKMLSGE